MPPKAEDSGTGPGEEGRQAVSVTDGTAGGRYALPDGWEARCLARRISVAGCYAVPSADSTWHDRRNGWQEANGPTEGSMCSSSGEHWGSIQMLDLFDC